MKKPPLLVLGAAGVFLIAGVAVLLVGLMASDPTVRDYLSETSSIVATAPAPSPTVEVNMAPVVRLTLPSIGVNADVVVVGVDPDGTMQTPRGPRDVGWYSFSARPGQAGNIVMTGHVDYINYGRAVFGRLDELREGDEAVVTLGDGASFQYRVSTVRSYDEATAPVSEIVGPTPVETLTLITCTGVFDRPLRTYDRRLVVQAQRVRPPA
jgi:LPXTG-site transpeptidase (sortase) family protein